MQSWGEIKKQFPNEHVVITNLRCPDDIPTQVDAGDVIDHDPDLDNLLHRCNLSPYDFCAVLYTGDLGALIGERGMVRVIEHD